MASCDADWDGGEWEGEWEECEVLAEHGALCDVRILSDGEVCSGLGLGLGLGSGSGLGLGLRLRLRLGLGSHRKLSPCASAGSMTSLTPSHSAPGT